MKFIPAIIGVTAMWLGLVVPLTLGHDPDRPRQLKSKVVHTV